MNVRADIPATVDAVLSVSSACECVTIPLTTAAPRPGQVVDETNRPIPYARVELTGPARRAAAYADKEGRFLVRVPIDGLWSISASQGGFDVTTQQLSAASSEPLVIRLRYVGSQGPPSAERIGRGCRCSDLITGEGR